MPLFIVHALDRPGALPIRLEYSAAHRAYVETLDQHGVELVLSGPLQSDDGETMIGSLFLINAPDRETLEKATRSDPFYTKNVWDVVSITRFHRRKG